MIQPQTQLTIADNTGARKIMCIRVLGGNKNYAAVLINAQNNPRGTRVFGPIAREIRDRNFTRVVSLAPEVL